MRPAITKAISSRSHPTLVEDAAGEVVGRIEARTSRTHRRTVRRRHPDALDAKPIIDVAIAERESDVETNGVQVIFQRE